MTNAINILIASPKGLMLDLLKVALSASPRFRVVAHINAAEEIAEVISRESIDIALVSPALAVATPKPNLFRRLLRELPNAKPSLFSSFVTEMSLWMPFARGRAA